MKQVALILLLVAACGGYFAWQHYPRNSAEAKAPPRPTTAVVTTRDIHFAVKVAGDIGPAEQVSVRPEINGLVKTLPVDIGDFVKAGKVLFSLDDQDLQTQRASRLIEIEVAKLQLNKAQRDYERSEKLYSKELISRELFDDTLTAYELAKQALLRAQKDLNLVEYQLTKTQILAPFDCTVLTRPVSMGQAVSGSSSASSGTEVMSIADLKNLMVTVHLNQADVVRVAIGNQVSVTIDTVPGLTLKGTVERIAPQSSMKNSVKGYPARILIKNPDPRVRPGMSATVTFSVGSVDKVLAIPISAIFNDAEESFAYVQTESGFEKRLVQVGVMDYDVAEVQKGLSAGDVISLVKPAQVVEKSKTSAAAGTNGAATKL